MDGNISSEVFDYFAPQTVPIGLLSIPHSGEIIPEEFLPYLTQNRRALDEDVDYRVRDLIDLEALLQAGVHVLVAKIHRTAVDLNRAPQIAVLNWKENTQGVQLINEKNMPDDSQMKRWLARYHTPYFNLIQDLLDQLKKRHKATIPMIDLHSMPSAPTAFHLKNNPQQKVKRSDFCVSDLQGESCSREFIDFVVEQLTISGFSAEKNEPYFGGYVTKFVNAISRTNNIQIEINRATYMDEVAKTMLEEKAARLKKVLNAALLSTFQKFS